MSFVTVVFKVFFSVVILKGNETTGKEKVWAYIFGKRNIPSFCFFLFVYAMNIKKHITEDCTSFSLLILSEKKDVEMLARKPFKLLTHMILKSFQ